MMTVPQPHSHSLLLQQKQPQQTCSKALLHQSQRRHLTGWQQENLTNSIVFMSPHNILDPPLQNMQAISGVMSGTLGIQPKQIHKRPAFCLYPSVLHVIGHWSTLTHISQWMACSSHTDRRPQTFSALNRHYIFV